MFISGTGSFNSATYDLFLVFFNCLIAYQNIIPIALYISLEVAKTIQSYFINKDIDMYDEISDQSALPKSWNLCDDLGQIEYIFSDKTGTLTCNVMDFKKASINGQVYGGWLPHGADPKKLSEIQEDKKLMISRLDQMFEPKYTDQDFGFIDSTIPLHISENKKQGKRIREFFSLLAICHTVLVEKPDEDDEHRIAYRAQSPDEAALVNAAKNVGFVCLHRTENKIELDLMGDLRTYTILNIMEFNSDRKRMSVIVQRPEGDIILMCKGADSVIYERLNQEKSQKIMESTSAHLQSFANEGNKVFSNIRTQNLVLGVSTYFP